jgi:hypothetical protein
MAEYAPDREEATALAACHSPGAKVERESRGFHGVAHLPVADEHVRPGCQPEEPGRIEQLMRYALERPRTGIRAAPPARPREAQARKNRSR